MESIVVRTVEELKEAKERSAEQILAEGSLVHDLLGAEKIATDTRTLEIITAGIRAGDDAEVLAAAAGISASAAMLASALGVVSLEALYKEYDYEVVFDEECTIKLRFVRKRQGMVV